MALSTQRPVETMGIPATNVKQRLLRWIALSMAPQDLANMAGDFLPSILEGMSRAERIDFLHHLAGTALPPTMAALDREARASLINALVPLLVCEFPLSELDLLTALEESPQQANNRSLEGIVCPISGDPSNLLLRTSYRDMDPTLMRRSKDENILSFSRR